MTSETSLARYALVRTLLAVPTLALVSLLVFLLVAAAGDPLADLRGRLDVTPADIDARRAQLHLDDPLLARYGRWASGALRGDLGESTTGRDVAPLVAERLAVTLRLVGAAFAIALAGAVALAALSAHRPYSGLDHAVTVACFGLLAVPTFWLGSLLKEGAIRLNDLLAPVVGGPLLFTAGAQSPALTGGLLARWVDYAGHLVLPTVALALILVAAWSRYLRAAALDSVTDDHVRAARARGVGERSIALRHRLRPSLVPVVSIAAVDFGQLVGGAVVVEQVFGWNGMGRLLLDGVRRSDTNVVLAWLLVTAAVVVVANVVADLVAARLDPRIRLG